MLIRSTTVSRLKSTGAFRGRKINISQFRYYEKAAGSYEQQEEAARADKARRDREKRAKEHASRARGPGHGGGAFSMFGGSGKPGYAPDIDIGSDEGTGKSSGEIVMESPGFDWNAWRNWNPIREHFNRKDSRTDRRGRYAYRRNYKLLLLLAFIYFKWEAIVDLIPHFVATIMSACFFVIDAILYILVEKHLDEAMDAYSESAESHPRLDMIDLDKVAKAEEDIIPNMVPVMKQGLISIDQKKIPKKSHEYEGFWDRFAGDHNYISNYHEGILQTDWFKDGGVHQWISLNRDWMIAMLDVHIDKYNRTDDALFEFLLADEDFHAYREEYLLFTQRRPNEIFRENLLHDYTQSWSFYDTGFLKMMKFFKTKREKAEKMKDPDYVADREQRINLLKGFDASIINYENGGFFDTSDLPSERICSLDEYEKRVFLPKLIKSARNSPTNKALRLFQKAHDKSWDYVKEEKSFLSGSTLDVADMLSELQFYRANLKDENPKLYEALLKQSWEQYQQLLSNDALLVSMLDRNQSISSVLGPGTQ